MRGHSKVVVCTCVHTKMREREVVSLPWKFRLSLALHSLVSTPTPLTDDMFKLGGKTFTKYQRCDVWKVYIRQYIISRPLLPKQRW